MSDDIAQTWTEHLLEQLDWHWENQLRDRLRGLTDDEYFWEPASDCWSVRPRGTSRAPVQGGSGEMVIEFAFPEPEPAPVTTIAWRLGHVIVGVLAIRSAGHFGRRPTDYFQFEYGDTAAGALEQLDAEYATWRAGVAQLSEEQLLAPSGPAEGDFADRSMATLILHINREFIHHMAEICLLRDMYAHRQPDGTEEGARR